MRSIAIKRTIYGRSRESNRLGPPWQEVKDLQDRVDLERTGARLVQMLWVVVVGILVAATVA